MQWTSRSAVLALLIALAVPSAALAAGGPVPPVQGHTIGIPGSPSRYGAFGARGTTIVKRLDADGVPTGVQARVAGRYGISAVDYSGTTTGLAANGRTLILAGMQGSAVPRRTRLLVVNTRRLTIRARITLPGWSTVDAISPDGRWLYLIHYRSTDISKYEVLAYDLVRRRMLTKPIVDPHDADEPMIGFPMARVMSVGSRWAYTLYMRPSGAPFIHALDTAGRRAVCIDLPSLTANDIGNGHLRLTSGGALLHVDVAGVTRALINTRTLSIVTHAAGVPAQPAVSSPPARASSRPRSSHHSGGVPWELFAGLLAALAAVAVGVGRRTLRAPGRSRPRRGGSEASGSAAGSLRPEDGSQV